MTRNGTDESRTAWKGGLEARGVRIQDKEVVGSEPLSDGGATFATPLLDRGWLAISGADALAFLNGQLTADLADLSDERWQAAAYCSPKGRVLVLMRLLRVRDAIHVELPAAMAETVGTRLRQFILRSDVVIGSSDNYGAIAVWGHGASRLVDNIRHEQLHIASLPGNATRYWVYGPVDALLSWWDDAAGELQLTTTNAWRLQEIEAAWPEIGSQTSDRFLPQSLNLERWDALSFSKGCYPGQEIVARVRYLGRVTQHVYRAVIEGSAPAAGDAILDNNNQTVGQILYSATQYDHAHALVVLRASERCALAGGQQLRLLAKVSA